MKKSFTDTYYELFEIIKHIRNEQTGTPETFMRKLKLTKRQLYNYFKTLNDFDCPVKYDRNRKTYYFENGCKLNDFRANE